MQGADFSKARPPQAHAPVGLELPNSRPIVVYTTTSLTQASTPPVSPERACSRCYHSATVPAATAAAPPPVLPAPGIEVLPAGTHSPSEQQDDHGQTTPSEELPAHRAETTKSGELETLRQDRDGWRVRAQAAENDAVAAARRLDRAACDVEEAQAEAALWRSKFTDILEEHERLQARLASVMAQACLLERSASALRADNASLTKLLARYEENTMAASQGAAFNASKRPDENAEGVGEQQSTSEIAFMDAGDVFIHTAGTGGTGNFAGKSDLASNPAKKDAVDLRQRGDDAWAPSAVLAKSAHPGAEFVENRNSNNNLDPVEVAKEVSKSLATNVEVALGPSRGVNIKPSRSLAPAFEDAKALEQRIEKAEAALLSFNIERESLENELNKFPAMTAGRTVAQRRRRVAIESRLGELNKDISQVKLELRKLERGHLIA